MDLWSAVKLNGCNLLACNLVHIKRDLNKNVRRLLQSKRLTSGPVQYIVYFTSLIMLPLFFFHLSALTQFRLCISPLSNIPYHGQAAVNVPCLWMLFEICTSLYITLSAFQKGKVYCLQLRKYDSSLLIVWFECNCSQGVRTHRTCDCSRFARSKRSFGPIVFKETLITINLRTNVGYEVVRSNYRSSSPEGSLEFFLNELLRIHRSCRIFLYFC